MINGVPQELDPGLRGRVLDALVAWSRGLMIAAAICFWIALALGMSADLLDAGVMASRVATKMVRLLIIGSLVGGLLLITVDNLRTMHYVDLLSKAGRNPDVASGVKYQARLAQKEHPFHTWISAGWVVFGIGIFLAFAAIVFIVGNEGLDSAVFAAVAGAAGIFGGLWVVRRAKKLRGWYEHRTPDFRIAASRMPENPGELVPAEPVGEGLKKWLAALERVAIIPSAIALIALIAWGAATGRLAVGGERSIVLNESFHTELSESDRVIGQWIARGVAATAIWGVLVSLVVFLIGVVQYQRAHRVLNEFARRPGAQQTYPRPEISALALTDESAVRRSTFYTAGAGIVAVLTAVTAGEIGFEGAGLLLAFGILLLVCAPVVDVILEPRDRARRNALLRTWPRASVASKKR